MRKFILYIIVTLAAVGCSSEKPTVPPLNGGNGELRFAPFTIETTSEMGESTRVEAESLTGHPLEITVSDSASGAQVVHYPSHLDPSMPLTTILAKGKYRVNVRSANRLPLSGIGFDLPQYDADTIITIEEGKVTTIRMNCQQTTCGVTVAYSDIFRLCFPDGNYYTEIFSSYGHSIDFAGETVDKTAYLEVPTDDMRLYYVVHRTTTDGTTLTDTTKIDDFARQKLIYHIEVSVKTLP